MLAPVGNVFVGVWINVLLGQTKVHNEHHLVLLHAGPTIQVQITNFLRPLFMNNFRQSSTYNKKNRPADEEVLRLDVSGREEHNGYQSIFLGLECSYTSTEYRTKKMPFIDKVNIQLDCGYVAAG